MPLGGGYQRLGDKYRKLAGGRLLGRGAYGKVYQVQEKATGASFACKEITKVRRGHLTWRG